MATAHKAQPSKPAMPAPAPEGSAGSGVCDARKAAIGALTGAGATAGGDTAPAPTQDAAPVDLGGPIRALVTGSRFNAMVGTMHRTVERGGIVLVTEADADRGVKHAVLRILEE